MMVLFISPYFYEQEMTAKSLTVIDIFLDCTEVSGLPQKWIQSSHVFTAYVFNLRVGSLSLTC